MSSKTIILVHGLSASKHSWDLWVARYQSRGYTVVAAAYHPGLDRWPSSNKARTIPS
jgi:alpha-beta hydrolase superfamily lysophospholipase